MDIVRDMSVDCLTLTSPTTLEWQGKIFSCQTGKGGIRASKIEGDGATPVGEFPLRQVYYRADRIASFACSLPIRALSPEDGWCDDPIDPSYNCPVTLPYTGRHEVLWRPDHVYDIILVVGHNDKPVIPHKGSAIFIHLLSEDEKQTEGCLAFHQKDLLSILAQVQPSSLLKISKEFSK